MPARNLTSELVQTSGLSQYADHFSDLIGDRRTQETFTEILRGIIGSQTLCCSQIAASSPKLAEKDYSEKRVRLFAKGETTKRSQIDEGSLSDKLRKRAVEHLQEDSQEEDSQEEDSQEEDSQEEDSQEENDRPWIVWDMSGLRKEEAREMEDLMKVRDLEGNLVSGYKMLVGLGIKEGRRAVLHHRVFSSKEAGFKSETAEVKEAIKKTCASLRRSADSSADQSAGQTSDEPSSDEPSSEQGACGGRAVHIMDRGFDDKKIWREIWERGHQLVCRIQHLNRTVFPGGTGSQEAGSQEAGSQGTDSQEVALADCLGDLEEKATVQTTIKKKGRRKEVRAKISSTEVEVPYREIRPGEQKTKTCWLLKVDVEGKEDPWYLLTDLPVEDEEAALEVFRMYRQRWSVEESFRFVKQTLGIEEAQLLALEAVRVLVSMGWIAAGYLYELGIGWEEPEVRLLAKLGGWEPRSDRSPGKETLSRGLSRLLEALAVNRVLGTHRKEHGRLPPRIEAFLEGG